MSDLISRQTVLRCIKESRDNIDWGQSEDGDAFLHYTGALYRTVASEECLPSAEPERLTDDDFETIRIHLNAQKEKLCNQQRWKEAEEYQRIIDRFMAFAARLATNLQQSCNNLATDTISRQDAIRWIKAECNPYGKPTLDYETSCRIMEHLDRMPSAEPERKKGEWIVEKDCEGKTRTCICGLCGYKTDKYTWKNPNYCSNCGADMRGDKNEDR